MLVHPLVHSDNTPPSSDRGQRRRLKLARRALRQRLAELYKSLECCHTRLERSVKRGEIENALDALNSLRLTARKSGSTPTDPAVAIWPESEAA